MKASHISLLTIRSCVVPAKAVLLLLCGQFLTLFVDPIPAIAQQSENWRGIEKKDIRSGPIVVKPGNTASISNRGMILYGTPLGHTTQVADMHTNGWIQPEAGISAPFAWLSGHGAKLTKADAARQSFFARPIWALDLHAHLFSFSPVHLLDGHEQQVDSFAATENTQKDWKLTAINLGPSLQFGKGAVGLSLQVGPSLVLNKPAQFRQGDPTQNVLYQDYRVPEDFKKLRVGAEGNVRINWYPFAKVPLGLYLKGGYFWQQPYSFPVRQRNISKVNFNLSPREIQYQLSNPQIAPFETHNYAIPHQFFFGQIGLSLVIKTKSSTIHSVHEPSGYTETRTVMPAQQPHSQQAFRIVLDEPRPHAVFRSINDIPAFRWHVEGTPPPQAQYQIEIFQLDENGTVTARVASGIVQPNRPFMIPAEEKSRMQLSRKNSYYSWKVTETTTGHSSGEPHFSVQTASCGTVIDSIMISCDGWDAQTGLPKYHVQICLKNTPTTNTTGCQANYSSITSSPTNAGTISNLTNIPVSIFPNQTACISFTYTPSSLSPAMAYFVVHGTWNDPLQNTVNILSGDSLPSCICHDCDSMQIQINQTQVQASASDPHLFDITGQVLANPQAIHALAFSIQSFSFTANPGGCAVVDSIEHDGMILSSGTTVNGSTANLVFGNAPAGNPNVFKLLKWISSPPVPAGVPVPFHLVVSLPAASSGLDPSCCQIQYQICLEVRVYYDACRYCTRTICLNFSNQKP